MIAKKAHIINIPKETFGLDEHDMYTEAGIMDFSDNDEVNAAEEAFMLGYLSA